MSNEINTKLQPNADRYSSVQFTNCIPGYLNNNIRHAVDPEPAACLKIKSIIV